MISLALNLSSNPFASYEIMFWLLGSFKDRSLVHAALMAPLALLGSVLLLSTARALDALTLGEDSARGLGVDMKRLRLVVIAGVALTTAAVTSVAGAIGFVGLVAPHLVRPFTNRLPGNVLLPSAFGGAVLLTFADAATRLLPTTIELNVGVVTALIGAPFFLWIVSRPRKEMYW
jgi:iron complex transport system permease protein